MPTMGTICWTGEKEDKNHVTRPIVLVNFDLLMDEVEATTKSVFSCTDNNMTDTHLYLYPPTISTLQILCQELRSRIAIKSSMHDHICHRDVQRSK